MTLNLIVNVLKYKNKLIIGSGNDIVVKIPEDLQVFKSLTKDTIVIMGRKTWYSLPSNQRPLKNRINIILTNDSELRKSTRVLFMKYRDRSAFDNSVYFFNKKEFDIFYKKFNDRQFFIIGGGQIYDMFLKSEKYNVANIYLTETTFINSKVSNIELNMDNVTMFSNIPGDYKLTKVSDKKTFKNLNYVFLKFEKCTPNYNEQEYLNLCSFIFKYGQERSDRTGTGTISVFGEKLEFDISDSVPLLTTKRVPWKSVIEELLWFMRGDTNSKLLEERGVNIWKGNTSREFLDKRGLTNYPEGTLGPLYGWQWRFFGAKYSHAFSDTSNYDTSRFGGFDQLEYIVNEIKTNKTSRRILMSYWNPPDFDKMCINPCHFSVQFYVTNDNKLDCLFNMRSSDVFLGLPFNIFSYAVLCYIIALKCDLQPGRLIYMGGDIHIYKNHTMQVREQLSRDTRAAPKLLINPEVKFKDFNELTIDDFDLVGYYPYQTIKGVMAV